VLQFSDGQLQIFNVLKILNFPHKFLQNGGFSAPNLVFFEEKILTTGKFPAG